MPSTFMYGGNVHANGIRQHYLRYGGQGRPLIVLPGITSPAITWAFVAERLGHHHDVHVLDVRGRGLSQADDGLDYSIDGCAADVPALVQALGFEDFDLLGHSFGARIAARAAARRVPGLRRLVLVDPPMSGPGRRPYPADIDWYVDSIRQMAHGGDHEAMRPYLPTWTDSQLRLRAEWLHTCSEKAVRDAYRSFHEDDMYAELPSPELPTLLIAAGQGDVVRPEEARELERLLPSLKTVRLPNAGHMVPWDDLEGFLAALNGFLD